MHIKHRKMFPNLFLMLQINIGKRVNFIEDVF